MEITDYTISYELYECLNEGEGDPIEIETSNLQDNLEFEALRKNIKIEVQSIPPIKDDVLILTIQSPEGGLLVSAYTYLGKSWSEITDSQYLQKKRFIRYEPYNDIVLNKLEKVKTWEDITENFLAFQEIDKNEPSQVLKKYTQFFHWYYWPEKDLFAPSKFLGYKNTTIANYDSSGSGGDTQDALDPFFTKLEHDSPEFKELFHKLEQLSDNNHGKKISAKVKNGLGGIYIPNEPHK